MEIKRLGIEDISRIAELRRMQELEHVYSEDDVNNYIPIYCNWLLENLNKKYYMFGIVDNEKIVAIYGLLLLEHYNERIFYCGNAYTIPEYRQKGLMTLLIEKGLEFAKNNNINISEAVIDSSTPDATWHLMRDKYGAIKQDNRYSILLNKEFRFETQNAVVEKNGDNKYILKNGTLETTIIADLDNYISHPLNPSGETLLLSIYNAENLKEEDLVNAIKVIINNYLAKGIYYFKVLCSNFNPQSLLDMGFKKETGYIRMLTKKGNE